MSIHQRGVALRKSRLHLKAVLIYAVLCVIFSEASLIAQETENYALECEKGLTIYCLAAGMEEIKSKNKEKALKYFRTACESHKTQGHLRACTPYLGLARELNRLDEASGPLETRCRQGEDKVCFYLAKEYLRIDALSRAHKHLERLCRQGFPSPNAGDYGPCYHLGDNLEKNEAFDRAIKIFTLECDRNRELSRHSCERLQALLNRVEQGKDVPLKKIRPFAPIETVAFCAVGLSVLGWGLWLTGRPWALQLLNGPLQGVTIVCWIAWIFRNEIRGATYIDLTYLVPSIILILGLWFAARKQLQAIAKTG